MRVMTIVKAAKEALEMRVMTIVKAAKEVTSINFFT
jgi:hypothetical protein